MCHRCSSFRALLALQKFGEADPFPFVEGVGRQIVSLLGFGLEALAADQDLVDLDFDEALAVALHLLVLLLALEVEDEDLVATAFADHGSENLGAAEGLLELPPFARHGDDFGKLDVAVLMLGLLDADGVAGSDAVLLTTG